MGFTDKDGTLTFAPSPDPKPRPNWFMRHKVLTGVAAFVLVAGIAGGASGGTSPKPEAASAPSSSSVQDDTKAEEVKSEPKPAKPSMTRAQENAVGSARDYLDTAAFSRSGLIKQLQYEGYSTVDATYGVTHAGADWGVQAEKSAEEYLSTSSFSRSGLIKQLEFEGFTAAQARRGATAVGL